ncbi:MAG: ribokinase [Actinobacteria bacterium]|nr:ribokinase [Actinomycetota bacterium]
MRVAVVGHHEWIEALRVDHLPAPGEIVHATTSWSAPAGGAPAAAGQLFKLAGNVDLFVALGDDELGHRAERELERMGFTVHTVYRDEPTRRGIVHIDDNGERTITVIGSRLHANGDDDLPWELLAEAAGCYFTAGDSAVLGHARQAKVLVSTSRVLPALADAAVQLDALVGSSLDAGESYQDGDLVPLPHLVVRTASSAGGTFQLAGEEPERYEPAPLPGPIVDRYGAGDCFAGGLTFALAEGRSPREAVAFAARCGASVLMGRGPYETQLTLTS